MTRKSTGERRKFTRTRVQEGVRAAYRSRVGQVLDIGMGGLAFCCTPSKKAGTKNPGDKDVSFLSLYGKIHLEGLPVRPISQSEVTVDSRSSRTRGKMTRYSFEFGDLAPQQSMLLHHFIRIHCLEECKLSLSAD